jgi:hypothetical protein
LLTPLLDLEKASEQALAYGNTEYRAVKTMLENDLLSTEAPPAAAKLSELGQSFLRQSNYFSGEDRS